jgi:hypothetical protein
MSSTGGRVELGYSYFEGVFFLLLGVLVLALGIVLGVLVASWAAGPTARATTVTCGPVAGETPAPQPENDGMTDGTVYKGPTPMQGLVIDLWRDRNCNQVKDDGPLPIATATTSITGYYVFRDLAAGCYLTELVSPQPIVPPPNPRPWQIPTSGCSTNHFSLTP